MNRELSGTLRSPWLIVMQDATISIAAYSASFICRSLLVVRRWCCLKPCRVLGAAVWTDGAFEARSIYLDSKSLVYIVYQLTMYSLYAFKSFLAHSPSSRHPKWPLQWIIQVVKLNRNEIIDKLGGDAATYIHWLKVCRELTITSWLK